jgi:hypothetical protein
MMFVILKFMDEQKYWGDLRKEQREKIKANRAGAAKRRVVGRKLPVAGGEGQSAGAQTQVGQS